MRIYSKTEDLSLEKSPILLASGSPRRRELLKTIIKDFDIVKPEVEEERLEKEFLKNGRVEDLAAFLSLEKAKSISSKNLILSGDTIVLLEHEILGKPKDYKEAKKMLISLFGKNHQVTTGVTIRQGEEHFTFSVDSFITFVDYEEYLEEDLENYLKSESPYDKAGSYGIQDLSEYFIDSICGDFNNIVGFPITKIRKVLYSYGWSK